MAAMREHMSSALDQMAMACTKCDVTDDTKCDLARVILDRSLSSVSRSLASELVEKPARKMVPNEFPENQAGGFLRRST